MTNQISTTFGSMPILSNIQNKYPDRKLIMYSATNKPNTIMLLDQTNEKSVFSSPVNFDILAKTGNQNLNLFINFTTIFLGPEQQQVFDSKINLLMTDLPYGMETIYSMHYQKDINRRVILTSWQNPSDFNVWKNDVIDKWKNTYKNSQSFYFDSVSYKPIVSKKA